MFEILILLLIVLQYVSFSYSIVYKKNNLFCQTYIFSIFFYDYFFINASYYLPELLVSILKPLNEYIFIYFIVLSLNGIARTKKLSYTSIDKLMIWYVVLPCLIIFITSDLMGDVDVMSSLLGFRSYILPIIVPYLFYKRTFLDGLSIRKILNLLFSLSFLSVVFAFIQREGFNGDLSQLWFSSFFSKYKIDPVMTAPYDFIRNDVLRAPSFFVSPIIYSIGLSITTVMAFNLVLYKNAIYKRKFLFGLLAFFVFGLFLAETRVGLFIALLGFGISFMWYLFKQNLRYFTILLMPISFIMLTFVSLIFGYTDDLSALGRLEQYINFGEFFVSVGHGFKTIIVFDSFYLSVLTVFGFLGVFIFMFYIRFNYLIYKIAKTITEKRDIFLIASVFTLSTTFIYSFAFQLTAGSYSYKLMFFLMFLLLSLKDKRCNLNGNL